MSFISILPFIHFHIFALSSWICSSTLHPNTIYIVAFAYVGYYFIVVFVPSKIGLLIFYSVFIWMWFISRVFIPSEL